MRETKVLDYVDLIWMDCYKTCWNIIPDYLMVFLNEFNVTSNIPKEISAIFLTLIPNVENVQEVRDFKTICLVTSLYRTVAKVLEIEKSNFSFDI